MRFVDLSFLAVLAVGSAQCARAEVYEDGRGDPMPSIAPAAGVAKPSSDAPGAIRVPIDGLPAFGSARALVTVVAFTDYDCPYCAKADQTMTALRAQYGDDLRLVVASRPLAMHERAAPAARAFLAAAQMGKAEAMHAKLFATRGAHDDDALRAAAIAIGLDGAAFDRAIGSRSVADALAKSEALAAALDVKGTPSFFVNGRRIQGAQPQSDFIAVIDEELAKAHSLVARGVAAEDVYKVTMTNAAAPPKPTAEAPFDPVAVMVPVEGAPVRGSVLAPVTIVLFSDFECPYCVKLEATLKQLEDSYHGRVKVAYRWKPLPMHEHARLAAKASVAADAQGKFWAYHDALVAHRDALDLGSLQKYASDVGLDLARFNRDLDDPKTEARVAADEAAGEKLGVKGTPTSFVNGRRIVGAQPLAAFKQAVDRGLAD
ncbi:MAG TPA: thioredoxin domain-containing protein [Labilithrix sp.]|jgi:protein-disulfide isomerase